MNSNKVSTKYFRSHSGVVRFFVVLILLIFVAVSSFAQCTKRLRTNDPRIMWEQCGGIVVLFGPANIQIHFLCYYSTGGYTEWNEQIAANGSVSASAPRPVASVFVTNSH